MFPPLPEEPARTYARELMSRFDREGVRAVVLESLGGGADSIPSTVSQYARKPDRPDEQMFGILVCTDADGNQVVLRAFSGQFESRWNIPGWVPPLLDEAAFARLTAQSDARIHALSEKMASLASSAAPDVPEKAGVTPGVAGAGDELASLKAERRAASRQSMHDIFALYRVPVLARLETVRSFQWTEPRNGKTYPAYETAPVIEERSIFSFYGDGSGRVMPPTGAGECCAPKLLAFALTHGLHPVSLAEFFYSQEPAAGSSSMSDGGPAPEGRRHGCFYGPCDEKCGPVLPAMLGLKVLYLDEHIVVVEKPSGLLSVPGRGPEKQDCVVNRVKWLYPGLMKIVQPSVHRLDMETSGLLVLAFTEEAHRDLSRQFEAGTVFKQYVAVLDGIPEAVRNGARSGRFQLPFRLDPDNRPHQVYDEVYGKMGITDWEFLSYEKGGRCRMLYTPQTGRTHQLRLHSADPHGFGVPIAGDTLYGRAPADSPSPEGCPSSSAGRLLLHAAHLSFRHPVTGEPMTFQLPSPF